MNRKNSFIKYNEDFGNIPIDYNKRLEYMYDLYSMNEKKCNDIINKRNCMMSNLKFNTIKLVLFELPQGAKRPRTRIVNRKNFGNCALTNPNFVHIYSPGAKEDNVYMRRMFNKEINQLEQLLYTPINVVYKTFFKTPKNYSISDKFLSEIGLIRPIVKPDWDNIGKKYSDMSNGNIWLDDSLVISGVVDKYYSILPRIEITIEYLNMLYNKSQYNTTIKRKNVNDIEKILYFKGE